MGVHDRAKIVEDYWRKLEAKADEILTAHASEVIAVAEALLVKYDMTGKECIEIIRSAANGNAEVDSESMLKALIEETIASANGKSEDVKATKKKSKSKAKAQQVLELEKEES